MLNNFLNFLQGNHYCNGILICGTWVVYKFQHFIWEKKVDVEKGEIIAEAKSIQEATFKTKKYIMENHPQATDQKFTWWELGGKIVDFSIVVTEVVVRFIFVPMKRD